MTFQRGDVVLVPFPFTDFSRQKARPAVVVSSLSLNGQLPDVVLAAISSRIPAVPGDMELVLHQTAPGFAKTGLRVTSVIKAAKLVTMQQSLVYTTLGQLDDQMLAAMDERIARALGLGRLGDEIAARRRAEDREEELLARISQLQERLADLASTTG